MKLRTILIFALVIVVFLAARSSLEVGSDGQGRQQLEEALRRTAVSCFAAEGAYPPSVQYMQQHYGLQYDQTRFTVRYGVFASNLMPDITVLEVGK